MRFVLVPIGSNSSVLTMIRDDGVRWSLPADPDNTDYQAYLAWLAEGNQPEEAQQ